MGGSSKNTTNTVAEPWKEQKPYLEDVFRHAQAMYDSGGMNPAYYGGQTVAAQSDYTQKALQMQAQRAMNGSPLIDTASGTVNGLLASGMGGNQGLAYLNAYAGSDPLADSAGYAGMLRSARNAMGNPSTAALAEYGQQANPLRGDLGYQRMYENAGTALNGNAGMDALESMSSAVNPYMDSLYSRAADQALSKINGNFSQAGRYGSGAHEAAAADAAQNLANEMYGHAYDQSLQAAQAQGQLFNQAAAQQLDAYNNASNAWMQAQQNRLNALNQSGALWNQGLDNQIGAYNAANDAYLQNQLNMINAAGNAGDMYNSGLGALFGGAAQAQELGNQAYQDAAALSEAGGIKDDYRQMLINAAIDRYNYEANGPLNALSNYMQLINGTYGGTSTSTGKQGSSGAQTLGNAIGGATAAIGAADIIRNWLV